MGLIWCSAENNNFDRGNSQLIFCGGYHIISKDLIINNFYASAASACRGHRALGLSVRPWTRLTVLSKIES